MKIEFYSPLPRDFFPFPGATPNGLQLIIEYEDDCHIFFELLFYWGA